MTVTVACCFADGDLPSSWFRLYQRLKLAVSRACLDADVRLVALRLVTDDAAVIVVPPELEGCVSQESTSHRLVVGLSERDADGLRALVGSLASMGAGPAPQGRQLAHHRGFHLVSTRVTGAIPSALSEGA